MVGIGLQRRHEPKYIETIERLHDGAIGDIICPRSTGTAAASGTADRKARTDRDGVPGQQLVPLQLDLRRPDLSNSTSTTSTSAAGSRASIPSSATAWAGRRVSGWVATARSRRSSTTRSASTRSPTAPRCSARAGTSRAAVESCQRVLHGSKGTANPAGWIEGPNAWKFAGDSPGRTPAGAARPDRSADARRDLQRGRVRRTLDLHGDPGSRGLLLGKVIKWDDLLQQGHDLAPGIDDYTLDSSPPVLPGPNGGTPFRCPASTARLPRLGGTAAETRRINAIRSTRPGAQLSATAAGSACLSKEANPPRPLPLWPRRDSPVSRVADQDRRQRSH